jgi:predicted alpha/beta superfamily hydrolase
MIAKIYLFIVLLTVIKTTQAQQPIPNVVNGKVDRIEQFQSKYVSPRNIDIWLPQGYTDSTKYAVLYMHDGQMLYDATQTWNKQAWDIDDVASDLLLKKAVKNFIVVGIWNGGTTRHQDYFPSKPFSKLTTPEKDTVIAQLQRAGRANTSFQPQSDKYLKFLVKELKPYIDKKYSVFTNRENTFIAGSSMGGLISLYGICEYPKIFGGAACLSTHWVGTFTLNNNPIPNSFINYLRKKLPTAKHHKIYFDLGDQTLDALYPSIQIKVDSLMKSKNYTESNWVTRYFSGDDHSEKSWNKRLPIPLLFLLKK